MNRPLFISIDGPKGTGKTTLLEAVTQALRLDGNKVIRLCERKNDPHRGETMALVNQLSRSPCQDLEFKVCERFAESRAWISRHILPRQPADSIILIDRWYPSDAAFRRTVPFDKILRLNLETPRLPHRRRRTAVLAQRLITKAPIAEHDSGAGVACR